MWLEKVHDHIDQVFGLHVAKAQEFLRKPSISAEGIGLEETAQWLSEHIQAIGGRSELIQGQRAPLVLARFGQSKPKTLLVYGMYDVQPVDESGWTSPPFAAEIRRLGDEDVIVARGACNSKGPLIGFLNAVHATAQVDELPVNLILTIEGEEEIGSPSLHSLYLDNREALKADAAFEPFWAEYGTDVVKPTLSLGTRGILSVDLVCRGGEWGGPVTHPVHSSVAGWLASPTWRLIKALATLVDDEENITIEGFQDEVVMRPEDEELLSKLASSFNGEDILKLEGACRFKHSLEPLDLLRKYYFSPTLSISVSAQTDADVIPAEARAQLLVRLVPEMRPQTTAETLRRHFVRHGYSDIEVVALQGYPGARTSMKEPVVQSMLRAYRYHGCEPQVLPLLPSATPYYLFTEVLRIPYIWGGLGRAGGSHAPDEFASVNGLRLFEKSIVTFMYMFANA
jgi:acetylornithine deacetylase/succinyl-diaminopimelate desuccinylase-like protein